MTTTTNRLSAVCLLTMLTSGCATPGPVLEARAPSRQLTFMRLRGFPLRVEVRDAARVLHGAGNTSTVLQLVLRSRLERAGVTVDDAGTKVLLAQVGPAALQTEPGVQCVTVTLTVSGSASPWLTTGQAVASRCTQVDAKDPVQFLGVRVEGLNTDAEDALARAAFEALGAALVQLD